MKLFRAWAYANGVTLEFSRLGKRTASVFTESFNESVRAKWLEETGSCRLTMQRKRWKRGELTTTKKHRQAAWVACVPSNFYCPSLLDLPDEAMFFYRWCIGKRVQFATTPRLEFGML